MKKMKRRMKREGGGDRDDYCGWGRGNEGNKKKRR